MNGEHFSALGKLFEMGMQSRLARARLLFGKGLTSQPARNGGMAYSEPYLVLVGSEVYRVVEMTNVMGSRAFQVEMNFFPKDAF